MGKALKITAYIIGFALLSSLTLIWHLLHQPHPVDHSVSLHRPATSASYGADSIPAAGKTLVATQSGHDSGQSPVFTAPADWHLYWSFKCAEEGTAARFSATVLNPAGQPTTLQPIQKTQSIFGFGDQPYQTAGAYQIKVDSPGCSWKITVKTAI